MTMAQWGGGELTVHVNIILLTIILRHSATQVPLQKCNS